MKLSEFKILHERYLAIQGEIQKRNQTFFKITDEMIYNYDKTFPINDFIKKRDEIYDIAIYARQIFNTI